MAKTREIRTRIKSVRNTHKITKTMDMVARSKSARLLLRVNRTVPYFQKICRLIHDLAESGGAMLHGLFAERKEIRKVLLFAVTSNRGLCGAYNARIVEATKKRMAELTAEGKEPILYVLGKRGNTAFRFIGMVPAKAFLSVDEKVTFDDSEAISRALMNAYLDHDVDMVEIIYTHFEGRSRQTVKRDILLPVQKDSLDTGEHDRGKKPDYIIEPSVEKVLESVVALMFKTYFYKILLESFISEQLMRGIAMKNATDSAEEMIKVLSMKYNRARQSQITGEILEILGGSESLK